MEKAKGEGGVEKGECMKRVKKKENIMCQADVLRAS